MKKVSNREIYNEMDDFCAEVLDSENFLKYIEARRKYYYEPEEAINEYFNDDEEVKKEIETFGDFYYYYLSKHKNAYLYKFRDKKFTENFKKLLNNHNIDPVTLDIDWDNVEKKENIYQEVLFDILYAMINYELKKKGYIIFGMNMGFESAIYFIVTEETYKRINKNAQMFKIFNLEYLESIYNEIYEVRANLGAKNIEIGDFIEKRGNEFHSLFENIEDNVIIKNINEDDEREVKLIL